MPPVRPPDGQLTDTVVGLAFCEEHSLCGQVLVIPPRSHLTIHGALREQQVQREGSAKHSSPCPGFSASLVKDHLCSTTKSFWAESSVGVCVRR